jgi:CIC family chloride channel protein
MTAGRFAPTRSATIARPRGWVERVRERLSRAVARGSGGMLVLSLLVGAGAGLGAVAFRYMILGFTYAITGHRDCSAIGHAGNPLVPGLGMWFVVLAPVVGGLIYGPLVSRFAPEARGHGVPEVMLAVNESRLRLLVACGAAAQISATFNAADRRRVLRAGADPAHL